jgi:hypothetical protein
VCNRNNHAKESVFQSLDLKNYENTNSIAPEPAIFLNSSESKLLLSQKTVKVTLSFPEK